MYWLHYGLGAALDWYPLLLVAAIWPRRGSQPWLPRLNGLALVAGLLLLVWYARDYYTALRADPATVDPDSEQYALLNRAFGPYAWAYWLGVLPMLLSQAFWWPHWRRSVGFSVGFALSWYLLPVAGRAVVILSSWHRDYLPSSWAMFEPDGLIRAPVLLGLLALVLRRRRRHARLVGKPVE